MTETRSFSQFLGAAEDGQLHGDLTEALVEIIAALNDHRRESGGKPSASLSLTFKFTLDKDLVEVASDFAVKTPRQSRAKSIFWTTPENHLSRVNPKQPDMFRDVNTPRPAPIDPRAPRASGGEA